MWLQVVRAGQTFHKSWFAGALTDMLNETIGPAQHVDSQLVSDTIGVDCFKNARKYAQMTDWLNQAEESNQLVVYEADNGGTPWTKFCIRQVLVRVSSG